MVFNIVFDIAERITMDVLPQASLFLGIIPALIILFIALKGYDGYYKDKNMFLSFVVGIIFGFIAAFVQSLYTSAILFIIILAIFNQLFKTIVLNIRRLHQKKETPIYGLSLGLGFGSSFTPFMLISASVFISTNINILSIFALGSLGIIFFHGATGTFIGYGIFEKKLTRILIISILLELPLGALFGLMIFYSNLNSITYQIIFSLSMVIYGLIIFIFVIYKILPDIKTRKDRRKNKKVKKSGKNENGK